MQNTKYTLAAIGLLSIFALMVVPADLSATQANSDITFYGAATLVHFDAYGNELFRQTVHNQLVDTGETFMLGQTFDEDAQHTDVTTEASQIGAICIDDTVTVAEGNTAADFSGVNNGLDDANDLTCVVDTSVDITGTQGKAVIGPLTFSAGGTNLDDGDLIDGIGICQGTGGVDYQGCDDGGILFASVETSDVTVNAGESVQITYTFDLTSGSS